MYHPIAFVIPEYDRTKYKNWWMKAYEQGTQTPLAMSIDSAGTTTAAKFQLDDFGFPVTAGGDRLIPYLNKAYDIWLIPTEEEADSDITANAIQLADNITPSGIGAGLDSMADLLFEGIEGEVQTLISFHDGLNKGGGSFWYDSTQNRANHNGITIIDPTNAADLATWGTSDQTTWFTAGTGSGCWMRVYDGPVDQLWSGAKSDDSEDDTIPNGAWLDLLISSDSVGAIWNATTLSGVLDKTLTSGIKIIGNGVFKYTGAASTNFIKFSDTTGIVDISGITLDGNDLAKRCLEIRNEDTTSSTLGTIVLNNGLRIINAKTTTPDTGDAYGCYIVGGYESVLFDGEIDGVDNTLTSGAVSQGFSLTWSATASDDYSRSVVIGPNAKIRNIKNSNTVLADADGIACFAPTGVHASLTVSPGALFTECKGRAIKSQIRDTSIVSPIIRRSEYDGIAEIDLQYSGGNITNARIYHDGVRVDQVLSVTHRLTPDVPHCTITGNQLTVTGTPATDTEHMIFVWGTDNTDAIELQGVTIRDNKCFGAVDYFATVYAANVVDTNRVIIDGNWAQTVNTSFFQQELVFNNNSQLNIVFTNNGAENQCDGATIVSGGKLIVEYERNNHNITALLSTPYSEIIASGVVTARGSTMAIDTESSASTDDLDTINGAGNRGPDDWLTLVATNSARTIVCKDGTGNLNLAGDFSLDNTEDVLVLRSDGTNWNEVTRSDNGA